MKHITTTTHKISRICHSLGLTTLIAAVALLSSSCKTQQEKLTFKYNGAIFHLPEEIDCITKNDTLYVVSIKNCGEGCREIVIGYSKIDTVALQKFIIK